MMSVLVGSMCAGYGGLELALRLNGVPFTQRWHAEIDPDASRLLKERWPEVPNIGDITAIDWNPPAHAMDLLLAGFPCQPTSAAGRRLGDADPRWLWPHVLRAVEALRPSEVFIENVRGLVSFDKGRLWREVLDDLARAGYSVRFVFLGACHVEAAHHRHRVFLRAFIPASDEAPTREQVRMTPCGAPRSRKLPTATARDGDSRGSGDARGVPPNSERRPSLGIPLDAAVCMLPTVTAVEWQAPGAAPRVGTGLDLRTAINLLPTPRASDGAGMKARPNQRGSSGDLALPRTALGSARFGQYAAAVDSHTRLYGEPPAPTEPNRNGNPRLAPAFAEWLMCLPSGHVTEHLDRVPALKAIGNGVCPPQAALAWALLNADWAPRSSLPLDSQ
jgi:DNA (cytosine-5)-methyltransferase 1